MNGPQHYREAEKCIGYAQDSGNPEIERIHLDYAQVHATLALAAATAMAAVPTHPSGPTGMAPAEFNAWFDVAGMDGTQAGVR